jgi:hypothetical protein
MAWGASCRDSDHVEEIDPYEEEYDQDETVENDCGIPEDT